MAETDSQQKTKNEVYYERNLLAIAVVEVFLTLGHNAGWWPDTDDVNGEQWAVVWADTPEGQVGWHVPKAMVPDQLPERDPEYDGYTTGEKNARVERLIGIAED